MISPLKSAHEQGGSDSYLVCFVSSGSGDLTLFAGGELGEVAMVVSLPVNPMVLAIISKNSGASKLVLEAEGDIHLVIEDL